MRRDFRIRRRPVLILLFPVLMVFWMVGWVICNSSSPTNRKRKVSAPFRDDGVEFQVGLLREDVQVKT